MHELTELLARHGLFLVFANVLLTQAGIPVPAIPLLVVAGAMAAQGGGDFSDYEIGRAVVYMQNRRDHPSGRGVIDFPGITILQYAGDGLLGLLYRRAVIALAVLHQPKGTDRQAHRLADVAVDKTDQFETSSAHVADKPRGARFEGDDAET